MPTLAPRIGFLFGASSISGAGVPVFSANGKKQLDLAFDYFVDGSKGDDTNDGSELAPFATVSRLKTIAAAITGGAQVTALVRAGEYTDDDFDPASSTADGQLTIVFEPDSRMVYESVVASISCINNNINGLKLIVYGNGLQVRGYLYGTGNGIGASDGDIEVHDIDVANCVDGFSLHGTSDGKAYGCRFTSCTKAAVAHINTTTAHMERCYVKGRVGASSASFIVIESSGVCTAKDCIILPSVDPTVSIVNGGEYESCQIGSLNQAVLPASNFQPVAISDSFCNVRVEGNRQVSFTDSYGYLSIRARNGGVISVNRCTWIGSATGFNGFIYSDFNPGSFGDITVTNTIVKGYNVAVSFGNNADRRVYWSDSNSSIDNCAFFENADDFGAQAELEVGSTITNITTAPIALKGTVFEYDGVDYEPVSGVIGKGELPITSDSTESTSDSSETSDDA